MKTILLPARLLTFFNVSKDQWPKVLCLVSLIHRYFNGRISYEYFEFEFRGQLFSVERSYNRKGVCLVENVKSIDTHVIL